MGKHISVPLGHECIFRLDLIQAQSGYTSSSLLYSPIDWGIFYFPSRRGTNAFRGKEFEMSVKECRFKILALGHRRGDHLGQDLWVLIDMGFHVETIQKAAEGMGVTI
jgi:hypothetical protein